MSDADIYCEQLVRDGDKDRFLATLFAPQSHRPALFALYAFDLETAWVAERVKEPLAGEVRLQWWHDAVSGAIPEQAAGHPVAAAVLKAANAYRLPPGILLDMIEAERLNLYAVDAGRESHAENKAVALLSLATRILNDGQDPGIDELIRHASAASAPSDPDRARRHLDAARALIASAPRAVLPAFLPLTLTRARLDWIKRRNDLSPDIPQWRRQWILWRASKNLSAWL